MAANWYRKAAALGCAKPMTKIGRFYEDGRWLSPNAATAFTWYRSGARGGDFRDQFNFASMLAASGQMQDALRWLNQVPRTATLGYKRLAGMQWLQSPHPAFQVVSHEMLDSLTPPATP